MDDTKTYWQDIVSLSAGIWLMLTLAVDISTVTVATGWLAYIGGAFVAMLAAGGLQDDGPILAWGAGAAGLLATVAPFFLGIADEPLALWSVVAGGAVALVMSAWSAVLKSSPARQPALQPAE